MVMKPSRLHRLLAGFRASTQPTGLGYERFESEVENLTGLRLAAKKWATRLV
jgi:hypothetical protein